MFYYFSLPIDYPSVARAWKYDADSKEEAIANAIAFLNAWNNTNITSLPEGTKIVKL